VTRIESALREGELKAIEALRPGVSVSEIFKTCVRNVQKKYPPYQGWYFGHGMGIDTHEPPLIVEGVSETLKRNMVVNIEVGYYCEGLGLLNVEDTLLITEDSHEYLSGLDQEIYVLA
jgi:Xaa-Pro aminopeptidase